MSRVRHPRVLAPALGRALPCALALLGLLLFAGPAAAVSVSDGGGEVSAAYDRLSRELIRELAQFQAQLVKVPVADPRPAPGFAPLTAADGRQGRALLESGVMDAALVMLDALQDLGVAGVKVDIPYPLLVPDQPRAAEFLGFYSRLAREIRRRGLSLYVHMTPVSRALAVARRGEDRSAALDRLAQAARTQAETVLAELKPDLLGLVNEPTNAAEDTGLQDLATAEGLTRFLGTVTGNLAHNGTRLAAGLGSWEAPELAAALVAAPGVEFLDIHVGALRFRQFDCLTQADEYAELARLLGKPAALGEVWLYKASPFELFPRRLGAPGTGQDVFRRDVYGFWSPLDAAFLRLMARLAQARGLEFICPSQPRYLFAYLEYEPHLERTAYPALMRLADRAAFEAMRRDHLSDTGRAFREVIRKRSR